jgi:hypothetical protein
MRFLPFHSTSRDNRHQSLPARSLHPVETRRPTGKSRHRRYHLHSCRDCRRPRCHPRYLRTRPRGASRVLHLLSPHHPTSRARRGLGSGQACQARSTHIPTPRITHSHAQPDRAPKAPVTLTHTLPFHFRLRRGSARQTVYRHTRQSFRPGRSLRNANNIDTVNRAGSLSRHGHIIAGRVTRCVSVLFILWDVDKRAHEGGRCVPVL